MFTFTDKTLNFTFCAVEITSLPFYVFYASWKTFYFPLSNYIRNYLKLTEIKSKFCWKMWISYWLDFKGHCREVWEVNSELTWHEWIGFKISLKLFLNFCSIQNNDNLIIFVFLRLWQKNKNKKKTLLHLKKASNGGVLMKRLSENMRQNYSSGKATYWNQSTWVLFCKSDTYFQNPLLQEYLWRTASTPSLVKF